MNQMEILADLQNLPTTERLTVIEAALHRVREELEEVEVAGALSHRQRKLADAAKALLEDYTGDEELTAFTALDGEDFHAAG